MYCRLPVFFALSVLIAAPAFAMAQKAEEPKTEPPKAAPTSGEKATSSLVTDAPLPGDYVLGNHKAPLTIVEYASMSCPHCAHFSNTVLPEIEKKYIATGKVNYILRQFPLNEPAMTAAELLDCIGTNQGEKSYYTFARVLFDAQNKWAYDNNYKAGLETISGIGGISKGQFEECINNTDRELKVLKAKQLANNEVKVPYTPYIFIAGEVFEGERTVEGVSKFIDAKLAEKGK